MNLPSWLVGLSPFARRAYPLGHWDWANVLVLTAIAVVLTRPVSRHTDGAT